MEEMQENKNHQKTNPQKKDNKKIEKQKNTENYDKGVEHQWLEKDTKS